MKSILLFFILSFLTSHTVAVKPKRQTQDNAQRHEKDEKDEEEHADNSSLDDESKEKKSQLFHFPAASPVLHSATTPSFQNDQSNLIESINLPVSIGSLDSNDSIDEKRIEHQSVGDVSPPENVVSCDKNKYEMLRIKLDHLPKDIISIVFKYLSLPHKNFLSQTCRRLNLLFNQIDTVDIESKKIHRSILSIIKMKSEFLTKLSLSDIYGFCDLNENLIRNDLKNVVFKRLNCLKLSKNHSNFFVLELIRNLSEDNLSKLNCLELSCSEELFDNNNFKSSLIQLTKSKNLCSLSCFIVKDNDLGKNFADAFIEGMYLGNFSNLTHLDISNNKLKASEMKSIFEAIQFCNIIHLSHLDLSRNQIEDDSIKAFYDLISSGKLFKLTHLIIASTELKFEGIDALVKSAKSKRLSQLTCLEINNNHIGNAGIVSFAEALAAGCFPNLTHLNIAWNEIGIRGALAIEQAIRSTNYAKITHLNISSNFFCVKEFYPIFDLIKSLHLSNLTNLNVSNLFDVNVEEAVNTLAQFLRESNHFKIKHLNVSVNQIGDREINTLVQLIKSGHLSNLTHLNVSTNVIGIAGMTSLFEEIQARRLPWLTHLNVGGNRVENGFQLIANAITSQSFSRLVFLNISWNTFSQEDTIQLAKYILLGYLPNLMTLDMCMYLKGDAIKAWAKEKTVNGSVNENI